MASNQLIYIMTVCHLILSSIVLSDQIDRFDQNLLHLKVPVRPPSISSIKILNRLRSKVINSVGPQRRMFFPFNRIILSMIAPRLMRFQFDMMLSSIIAEVVRKFVVPIMGSITGQNNDERERPNILSHFLSAQSSTQPPFDVKQLLIKAQNAVQSQGINVQNAIRTANGMPPLISQQSMTSIPQLSPEQMNLLLETLSQSLQNNNQNNNEIGFQSQQQINGQKIHLIQTPMSSVSPQVLIGQPIQMSPVTNFVPNPTLSDEHIQHTDKQNEIKITKKWKNKRPESVATNSGHDLNTPSFQMTHFPTNNSDSESDDNGMETNPKNEESNHLYVNYLDTNLISYGNQEQSNSLNELQNTDKLEKSEEQTSDSNIKNHKIYRINEEQERASRWNNILINMDNYRTKRRDMKSSTFYKLG